jgi:putative ABC transport system permease protein
MTDPNTMVRPMHGFGGDVRQGVRSLRKSPGLTAVASLTLALGIGANTAIFSVVNAVILRPLPFAQPERLVAFWGSAPKMGLERFNYPDAFLVHFRTRSRTLESIGAYIGTGFTLTDNGEPQRIDGATVTAGFFPTLGRAPLLGRTFLPEEETRGRDQVAVLSYGLWQSRFGGDPNVVGTSITLDDKAWNVVGVMPEGFDFPNRAQIWVPLSIDPQSLNCWCFATVGRLAPGRTPEIAAREISLLSDEFWRERKGAPPRDLDLNDTPESITYAMPLARHLVGNLQTPLLVLLAAVAMVLLIACANVANLLLARASARGREMAVRACLGASPWRMVRQLLVESTLLGAGGVVIGLIAAFWTVRAVAGLVVERTTHVQQVGLDGRVLLFTALAGLGSALFFGLAPALRGSRLELRQAVSEGARGTRLRGSRRLSEAFVVSQLALSLILLVGAGLLIRSFRNMLAVDLGFRPESVLVGRVSLPSSAYRDEARSRAFFATLAERMRSLPGVRAVGLSRSAPFSKGNNQQLFVIEGKEPAPGEPTLVASVRPVTPGYFAAVGTPLLRGRLIDDTDQEHAPLVVVVDETLAQKFWPDGNAVGAHLRLGGDKDDPWRTIVGVVASIKHGDVAGKPDRYVYVPHAQMPDPAMDVIVRSFAAPQALTAAVRQVIHELGPSVPLHDVHTLQAAVADALGTERLTNHLLIGFALTALALAAVGIYGVMALNVSQRTNEFGIRLALGATPADVLTLVLGQGLRLVMAGLVLGLGAALLVARAISSLLFQVRPIDPWTFAVVSLLLCALALAACALPARRATATDPLRALRHE